MKEHPILFSTDMVRAILEDRKTMTRRVIKPNFEAKGTKNSDIIRFCNTTYKGNYMFMIHSPLNKNTPLPLMIHCPYGQVGNKLWVKETWINLKMGKFYKADGLIAGETKWNNTLFMPRWASRITLEITGIRVERLREIDISDVRTEGIIINSLTRDENIGTARAEFRVTWDSINAKRGYSWESNPWVWVIEFRRIP